MRTIVIQKRENGRWMVHLRGEPGGEFDSCADATNFAKDLQARHGGEKECRIVNRHRVGEDNE